MPAVQYETTHFAFRWTGSTVTVAQAQAAGVLLEQIWDVYMNTVGFTEPYCDTATKYKVNIDINSSYGLSGGTTGTRDMGMWIGPGALADNWGLAHEFAHALQGSSMGMRDSPYVGWIWESHANWMAHQLPKYRGEVHCSEMLVNGPHLYFGSTRDRYCNWQFWEYLKDRYCYKAVNDIWTKSLKPTDAGYLKEDPFTALARNMGWTVAQLNDFFGEWAMHNVNWDYQNFDGTDEGTVYRASYGSYDSRSGVRALRVTQLDPMDKSLRRFNVPSAWAPQRWGYNLVRLYPDSGATSIKVTFRGVIQTAPVTTTFGSYQNQPSTIPNPSSGWRWGVVAIDSAGKARYSALQSGSDGELNFCVSSSDKSLWMVVLAAPLTMQQIQWDQMYYSIYRYPWMVQFQNAMPEGFQTGAATPTASGNWHSNGGGWVASGASVAATAYVGPYARVLGGKVTDSARIEDHAIIQNGTISGNAVVGGLSVISGNTTVTGNAKVGTVFYGLGAYETGITLSGTAQVFGDAEERGVSLSKGVFYGFIDSSVASDTTQGASRTAPVTEVTISAPYTWRN